MAIQWVTTIASAAGVLASILWIGLLVQRLRHRGIAVFLRDLPAEAPESGWPSVAVIFAARDEAGAVEAATRSLLAQDYPALELIAVDDRSTDATGAILDRLASQDPRLRVVHVNVLPGGWLGKNHALQAAADITAAEWLLFTDADVIFEPSTVRRALARALSQRLDHFTVIPETLTETLGEWAFMAMFYLLFMLYAPPWRISDPRSKAVIGVGAFNLVRAAVFRSIGGFRNLALSIDDDMRLAQSVKFAGYRNGFALGQDLVSVRWHVGIVGMIRGLEKNFFAGLDFRLLAALVGSLMLITLGAFPAVGLFVGPWWARAICALGVAATALNLAVERGQSGLRWFHAFLLPIGAIALACALLRSTVLTLGRGGVRWRGHHYPLHELKAHGRRRNAWLREVWRSTR